MDRLERPHFGVQKVAQNDKNSLFLFFFLFFLVDFFNILCAGADSQRYGRNLAISLSAQILLDISVEEFFSFVPL